MPSFHFLFFHMLQIYIYIHIYIHTYIVKKKIFKKEAFRVAQKSTETSKA